MFKPIKPKIWNWRYGYANKSLTMDELKKFLNKKKKKEWKNSFLFSNIDEEFLK